MRTPPSTVVVTAVVVLVLAGAAPAAGADATTIERVKLSGPAVVGGDDRPLVAGWRPLNLTASVVTGTDTYDVCVDVASRDAESFDCRRVAGTNTTQTVTMAADSLPENVSGSQELVVTVRPAGNANTSDPIAEERLGVQVLTSGGDVDDDSLDNRRELDIGTGVDVADTDGDGLGDGPEVTVHETDPTSTDTDSDGLGDGVEVNDWGSNPTETDTDGDGLGDGVEVTTHGTDPTSTDTDGDGLGDGPEVTVHETDPTSTDTDGDGLDDGPEVNVHETDPTSTDTDGDGLDDAAEVERYGTNPTQADTDGDGLNDGREVREYGTDPTSTDTDGDGLDDAAEVANGSDPAEGDAEGVEMALPRDRGLDLLVGLAAVMSVVLGALVVSRRGVPPWSRNDGALSEDHTHDGATDSPGATAVPTAAMSDEERVHALVGDNGGRIRQSAIVEETGWSKSKVSRVLSRMADEGRVEKVTIGRENLITYPDERPDEGTSRFEPGGTSDPDNER